VVLEHDSAIEASFFIDEDALARLQPEVRPDESGFLNAFDANRDKFAPRPPRFTYAVAGALTIWCVQFLNRLASIRAAETFIDRDRVAIWRRRRRVARMCDIFALIAHVVGLPEIL
jgi:hypothetical protein